MVQVEAGVAERFHDLLLRRPGVVGIHDAPEHRAAALDVHSGGDLLDHQLGIEPGHEVLHGVKLVLVADGEGLG